MKEIIYQTPVLQQKL